MHAIFKNLFSSLTVGLIALASGHAQATIAVVQTTQTFNFSGNCVDCALAANAANSNASSANYAVSATLLLQNYSMGSAINLGNIVSFSYGGSNLFGSFTWHAGELSSLPGDISGFFSGDINALDNQVNLKTSSAVGTDVYSFFQSSGNAFALGTTTPALPGANKDFGTGTWSTTAAVVTDPNQIPEPGSLLLVGGALAALGLARRRKP